MRGSDMGSLEVFVTQASDTLDTSNPAFSARGQQGSAWQMGFVEIPASTSLQVVFLGTTGPGPDSQIALDDFLLSEGMCPQFGSCDFEDDLCSWHNTPDGDDIDWMRTLGLHVKDVDHTLNTRYGHFLTMSTKSGKTSVFLSPVLDKNTDYCFTVWLQREPNNENTLTISTKDIGADRPFQLGNSLEMHFDGKVWMPEQRDIPSSLNNFHIIITGVKGNGSKNINIDDTSIQKGVCSSLPPPIHRTDSFPCGMSPVDGSKVCDFYTDCDKADEEKACGYNCDFEDPSSCKWTSSYPNSFSMIVINGKKSQFADHSTGSASGHFVSVVSNTLNAAGRGLYNSPLLKNSASSCEFKFYYYSAHNKSRLNIKKWEGGRTFPLTLIDSNPTNWQEYIVPIGRMTKPFRIQIQYRTPVPGGDEMHTYIDDLQFINCALPKPDACIITNKNLFTCANGACVDHDMKCNLIDDCGDSSDEDPDLCQQYSMCDFEEDLCYWSQDVISDSYNWYRAQTANMPDHSTGTNLGHYLSQHLSDWEAGSVARIASPAFQGTSECTFSFNYFIPFASKGLSLIVSTRNEINGDLKQLFLKDSRNGRGWIYKSMVINESNPFQVVVEIKKGQNGKISLGLDDTVFSSECQIFTGDFPTGPYVPVTQPPTPCDTDSQFECGDHSCVPLTQVCDFLLHCPNGEDEDQCGQCEFETDTCGWEDMSTGNTVWVRSSGKSTFIPQGPNQSYSQVLDGWYMQLAINRGNLQMLPTMSSPTFGASSSSCKASFWIYSSNAPDNFDAYLYLESSRKSLLWQYSAEPGIPGQWSQIEAFIGYQHSFSLTFKTEVITVRTVFAVDGISFSGCAPGAVMDHCPGQFQCTNKACVSNYALCDGHLDCGDGSDEAVCESYHICTFEDGACGYVYDNTGDFDWHIVTSDDMKLTPPLDHSTNSRAGHFMYLGESLNKYEGDKARLKSPVIFPTILGGGCIMSFFYYQLDPRVGAINVYVQYSEGGPLALVRSTVTDTHNLWMKFSVIFTETKNFRFILEGVEGRLVNGISRGAVAIDDITLNPQCHVANPYYTLRPPLPTPPAGQCGDGFFSCDDTCKPLSYICDLTLQCNDGTDEASCPSTCDFESGLCGWTNIKNSPVDFSVAPVSNISLASFDHNPGTGSGNVMAIINPAGQFEPQTLQSPMYTKASKECTFTFWYMTTLPVTLTYTQSNEDYQDLWMKTEDDRTTEWTQGIASLPTCTSDFNLQFTVTPPEGNIETSYFLLDGIEFVNCASTVASLVCDLNEFVCDGQTCRSDNALCDLKLDCCDGYDEDPYRCYRYRQYTFEWGFGEWHQFEDDDTDWLWYSVADASTLPDEIDTSYPEDHTFGSGTGHSALFTAKRPGETASMSAIMNRSLKNCRVRLWYNSNGVNSGTLNVYTVHFTTRKLVSSVQMVDSMWRKLDIAIAENSTYRLVVEAVKGKLLNGWIVVDDISLTPGCDMGSPTAPPIHTLPPMSSVSSFTQVPACGVQQFQCKEDQSCVSAGAQCDFNSACPAGSDEWDCFTFEPCTFQKTDCGWTDQSSANNKWLVSSVNKSNPTMAPPFDADYAKGSYGFFMYVQFKDASSQTVQAVSRTFNGAASNCRVQLAYFLMNTQTDLAVYVNYKEVSSLLWKATAATSNAWENAVFGLGRKTGPFTLTISKIIEDEYSGKTAIDNIQFLECQKPVYRYVCTEDQFSCASKACISATSVCDGSDDCGDLSDETSCDQYTKATFEQGLGVMSQGIDGLDDQGDWHMWTRDTPLPPGLQGQDHTKFSGLGTYMYAQSSGTTTAASTWLLSPVFSGTQEGQPCDVSFYKMIPSNSSRLIISLRNYRTGAPDYNVSTGIYSTGYMWTKEMLSMESTKPFQLIMEASFSDPGGAIGLDDFYFSPNCKIYSEPRLPDRPSQGCTAQQYKCHTSQDCIDSGQVCDHANDCSDGSDEINCGFTPPPTPSTAHPTGSTGSITTSGSTRVSTTPFLTNQPQRMAQGGSDSWPVPVGVSVGVFLVVVLVVLLIVYLKRTNRLNRATLSRYLRLPYRRSSTDTGGLTNPTYDYGTSGGTYQLEEIEPQQLSEPMSVDFGRSTSLGLNPISLDNPLYEESDS